MPTVTTWSNVSVLIQSALASAIAISGITKASPAVVSHAGSDPSNGAYVLVTATGMRQVDGRVFRVASSTTGSFALEGLDSSAFDTFESGSFQVITFGTSLATATNMTASGGDFEFEDTTTIHINRRTQIPTVASPAKFDFTNIWDPADAGLVALKEASDAQAQRAVHIAFPNGRRALFTGYIGATLLPTGEAQRKVETPVTITMFGSPTVYTT